MDVLWKKWKRDDTPRRLSSLRERENVSGQEWSTDLDFFRFSSLFGRVAGRLCGLL